MKTNKNKTSKSKRLAFLAKILALVASACVAVAVFTACDLTEITNSVVSQTETSTKGTQTQTEQTDAVVPEKNLAANKTMENGATTAETLPVENDQTMPPMNENGATPTDGQPPMNGRFSPDGQFPTDGQTPPELPSGEMPEQGENGRPPEMPNGEQGFMGGQPMDGQQPMNGQNGGQPSGRRSRGGEMQPPMGNGQMPGQTSDGMGRPMDGQTPPEMPNGEQPMGGQTPPNGQTIPNGETPPEIQIEGATV